MLAQRLAHHAADPAVADEHDVIGKPRNRDRLAAAPRRRRLGVIGLDGAATRQTVEELHEQRIDQDRDDGAGMRSRASAGRTASATPSPARMKENSPICARGDRDGERGRHRMAEQPHHEIGSRRLGDEDDEDRGEQRDGRLDDDPRIEQHADRDEEQHGEGVAQWKRLGRRLLAQSRPAQDHAGEEGAERQRNAEQLGGKEGEAERDRQHGEAVARGCRYGASQGMSGITFLPTTSMMMTAATLPSEGDGLEQLRRIRRILGALEHAGERRQQHQHEHHAEVLDDKPADGDAPALGIEQPALFQERSSTTVLAIESAMPKTSPAPGVQPRHQPTAMPSGAATAAGR